MERQQTTWAPLVIGLLFIVIGVAFLLDEVGFLGGIPFWRVLPPFILITLAIAQLLQRPFWRGHWGGGWLLLVGSLLLAHNLGVLPFSKSWPLFLIAMGAGAIVGAIVGPKEGLDGCL